MTTSTACVPSWEIDSSAIASSCADWKRRLDSCSRQRRTVGRQRRGHAGPEEQLGRRPMQDERDCVGRRIAAERPLPGEHLVEHGAAGEDVGALVDRAGPGLLWRQIPERAQHHARQRVRGGGLGAVGRSERRGRGQAEVEDLQATVGRQEDVVGLQVAVHDAAGMRGGEPGGELQRQADGLALADRAAPEARPQRLPVEQLGDEVRHLAGADVEDRQQVRVRQPGDRPRFPLEPREPIGVLGGGSRQHLHRDVTAEPRVARPIHLAHSAFAERRDDLVRAEPVPGARVTGETFRLSRIGDPRLR